MTETMSPLKFQRIVCYTDFTPAAERAFTVAAGIAAWNPGCELHLLHVIPEAPAQFWKTYIYEVDEDVDAKARAEIDAKVAEIYRPLVPVGSAFTFGVRIGESVQQLLDYAECVSCDLLVLSRPPSAVGNWLSRNFTGRVDRKAHCAVLLVPAAEG